MPCHKGTEGLAVPVLDPSAKSVGSQRHAPAVLPLAKEIRYPCDGG